MNPTETEWEITGFTSIFPIIGDPVAQVHCPQLLNPYFRVAGIDAVMVPLFIPRDSLAEGLAAIRRMRNIGGLVVTVPHKTQMARLIETLSRRARRLGAVNIVRRNADGTWQGDHFDGLGFVASLRERGWEPAGRHVFLVGCGGAGAAIADALAEAGAASLCLQDLDRARRDALSAILAGAYPGLHISNGFRESQHFDLLVNATPLGMKEADPLPVPQTMLRKGRLVADIVMTPSETELLQAAASLGCEVHFGEPMLRAQMGMMVDFFRGR